MRITAAATMDQRSPIALFAGSREAKGLPKAVREACEAGLKQHAVVVLPTLGQMAQPLVVYAAAPDWTDAAAVRQAGGALAKALTAEGVSAAQLVVPNAGRRQAVPLLTGFAQGAYRWQQYLPQAKPTIDRLRAVGVPAAVAREAMADAQAVVLCRDLVNTPAEDLGPAEFVSAARKACRDTGLKLRVVSEAQAKKLNMGMLLGVGRASPRRPRVLVIDWSPRGAQGSLLALCGKGVCFDTGGLNLKPGKSMELMRKDMGGAATVLAAMLTMAKLQLSCRVRAYLPLVENSVDGSAFRPGDILTAMNGTTVEIGNTDAEGRLILGDALCLARKEGCERAVTVATLTGAAMVALGRVRVPIMGTDEKLLQALERAANQAGEKVWRLPFDQEYHRMLSSPNAAMSNIGKGEAGCITAGCFLAHFAGDLPFAHCDISPASWQPAPHALGPAGATGVLVSTLARMAT